MNRRSFLSGIFKGAVAIAVAPQIVTHGLHLRKRLIEPAFIVNPEWVDAPYEVGTLWLHNAEHTIYTFTGREWLPIFESNTHFFPEPYRRRIT
jgi:hypothetical protein